MKKYLALLCASMLCVCCLALAACGGGASGSAASSAASASGTAASTASTSASASAASSSAAADPATLAGDWKLAAAEYQGVTVAGDFTMMLGTEAGMAMTLNADGTGSMTMGQDTSSFTWKSSGDNAIEVTVGETTAPAKYEDGAIKLTMQDDSFSGVAIFTKDGTYSGAKEITADSAKAITSPDAAVGSWRLEGVNMMGITMYGAADDLAAAVGDTDVSATFNSDGTGTVMGESVTWSIGDDGMTATIGGVACTAKELDGKLYLDLSSALGGSQMIFVYGK